MDRTSPTDPFDDVAYLARSLHRVMALGRLADGPAARLASRDPGHRAGDAVGAPRDPAELKRLVEAEA